MPDAMAMKSLLTVRFRGARPKIKSCARLVGPPFMPFRRPSMASGRRPLAATPLRHKHRSRLGGRSTGKAPAQAGQRTKPRVPLAPRLHGLRPAGGRFVQAAESPHHGPMRSCALRIHPQIERSPENARRCRRDRGKRNRGAGDQGNTADHHRGACRPRANHDRRGARKGGQQGK